MGSPCITHGSAGSRQHVWSFASALSDTTDHPFWSCSCSSNNWPYSTSFVGNDYFCDTGNHDRAPSALSAYPDDPLWDGAGCGPSSTCCTFNNPARPSPSPPLMTWRSGFVMNLGLETHLSSLWKFTCSSVLCLHKLSTSVLCI